MATVNLTWKLEVTSSDPSFELGSNSTPLTIASLTQTHHAKYSISTATKKTVLNLGSAATDDLPDADFICIVSTQDVSVELVGQLTSANNNLKIKANIPFILGFDDTRSYDAAGDFAGTLENLTYIRLNNISGSTATVSVFAAT